MKIKEIKELLDASGMPVAYSHFNEQTDPPFLVYLLPESRNIIADSAVYQKKSLLRVELYTGKKDIEAETKVENLLSEFMWSKSEEYLDSESMYEVVYEMEVMTE